MDERYGAYCLADPLFYDSPTLVPGHDFDPGSGASPEGWKRSEVDDWLAYQPEDVQLPPQGWKVHVSACLDNAAEILAAVWDYCISKRLPFKFIRNDVLLLIRNAKYADRGSSGKFATIYPADDAQLEAVLAELGPALEGLPGPYILSDLRWGAGPLHVRYGGFALRYCLAPNGERLPAIEDGDGRLVPDSRDATFSVPPWVTLPDSLAPHLAARGSATVDELPYRIEGALHFSNGGGLYLGVDRENGEQVVLKEARPHAGLSFDGADAVTRLRRERDMLERLTGLDCVPRLRAYLELGGHHFLVRDFVAGSTLGALLVERYPLTTPATDEASAGEYTSWVLGVCGSVEGAVAAIHDRGVVVGDVHPGNIVVRPGGQVGLIDFEIAAHVSEEREAVLAAPGFIAPPDRTGFDIDRYALACLRLYLFLPLTSLTALDPDKVQQLVGMSAETFPVPRQFLSEAVEVIQGPRAPGARRPRANRGGRQAFDPTPAGWRQARDSMVEAILSSATPGREDRLFPGDIRQFAPGGGLNIAYGAAGILCAIHAVGASRHRKHEEWLVHRATSSRSGTPLGFYDGLHGVAYVLDRLERRSEALTLLEICVEQAEGKWDQFGLDLFGGLAGIGLNLAYFAALTGESSLWDAAHDVAETVAARLGDEGSVEELSGGDHPYAGLMRGSSGPALMFVRLYEQTGDERLLEWAATALRQDVRRCVDAGNGALHVNEGWRTMPYLAEGSAGIGMVLEDYLRHRQDERFAQAAARIRTSAEAQFSIEAGLFRGRAGLIAYLSRRFRPGAAGRDPVVADHVRRLAWHALTYRGHLAFPGDGLLRISMDLERHRRRPACAGRRPGSK